MSVLAEPPAMGRWPGESAAGGVFAAVDLGTNNCRLLVARHAPGGFRVVDAFSRIIRLGEGLGIAGLLRPEAIDRAIAALRICAAKIRRRHVEASRVVATEACRRAANFADFGDQVARETGLRLEVISTVEEARLALAGCAPLLDPRIGHALVFDIGGGSTELMWATVGPGGRTRLIDSVSLPYGVVGLVDRFGGDQMAVPTYDALVAEIGAGIAAFDRRHGIAERISTGDVQMLGSSGTVTTLAGVFLDLPRYDRRVVDGSYLDRSVALRLSRSLLALDVKGRAAHPCIGTERADLVVGGCAVLEAILAAWPVQRLRIADRGVREGILLDLMAGEPLDRAV